MPRPALAAVVLGATILTACQTGQRPSFDTSPATSVAPNTTVLTDAQRLATMFDTSVRTTQTAVYEVHQLAQGVTATATFSRDASRTLVDVREYQYRESGGQRQTCNTTTGTCAPGFAEQHLSDLQITSGFWGPAVQQALTSPALLARIGPIASKVEVIAGRKATCVSIPGPGRTDRYCALEDGVLAAMDTAAVEITLTDYVQSFDESSWKKVKGG